jgi:hypothetical protein
LRTFFSSTADTVVERRRFLLRFFPLLESKWLLNPLFLLILPLPVTLNLLAAALLVLILGTVISFSARCFRPYFGVSSMAMLRPSRRGSMSTLAMSWI